MNIYFVGSVADFEYDAGIPVIDIGRTMHGVGGAAISAQQLALLGANVTFVTALGDCDVSAAITTMLDDPPIDVSACKYAGYKNPIETRVYSEHRMIAHFDNDTGEAKVENFVCDTFDRSKDFGKPDVILISDRGNAVVTEEVVRKVLAYAKLEGIPVIADVSLARLPLYYNVHIVLMSARQLRDHAPALSMTAAMNDVHNALLPDHLIVTRGSNFGAALLNRTTLKNFDPVPAIHMCDHGVREVIAATLAYATAAQMTIDEAVKYAMAAAAVEAECFGAAPARVEGVMRKMAFYGATPPDSGKDNTQAATPDGSA